MARIGYARVSTKDQKLDAQIDQLNDNGCIRIFSDKISGKTTDRPGRGEMLEYAREGDTIVVVNLSRFGRSMADLIEQVNKLKERSIEFCVLNESIDTATPYGRLVFHLFAAMAEFNRELIVDGTFAGLEAARARGRNGGPPRKLTEADVEVLADLVRLRNVPLNDICTHFEISRSTLYRYVTPQGERRI